ncbi:hypothetical protein OIU77_011893 [Salix suchowensis]|uniref:RNA-dependent RNA polymerase n=1 Tax=Salix suchowensis TaxID=1278906 RepID=A0ABQ9A3G9_9ROSI|nr:hypothetical protein OIU77_011893 [Salix suchowensis]
MRVLQAVDVPALHHMVDCIVFPQKGKRPHTNECSGSDLDGDVYFVCWDRDLIPRRTFPPMDYTAAPTTILDHDVTIEEVQEFFTDYLLNDSLGIICSAHTVFADREPLMARSRECTELARLSSIAVDFPKTGVPAKIPQELRVKEYPDFMEKPADKRTYKSQRVLGKLFRDWMDFGYHIDEAFYFKTEYDNKLGNMMDYFGIKTEAEIISGCIMKVGKSFDKKRDMDSINSSVRSLKKQARAWFDASNLEDSPGDLQAKASAWYHVTYHPNFWGLYNEGMNRVHFLSFPWCVHDILIDIKKGESMGGGASLTSLAHRFSRAFI